MSSRECPNCDWSDVEAQRDALAAELEFWKQAAETQKENNLSILAQLEQARAEVATVIQTLEASDALLTETRSLCAELVEALEEYAEPGTLAELLIKRARAALGGGEPMSEHDKLIAAGFTYSEHPTPHYSRPAEPVDPLPTKRRCP